MQLRHHKQIPVQTPAAICDHWIKVGDEIWYCTEPEHNGSKDHYNNVIHATWR